jgi:cobalt-zinc-cadmium efflux system outer membrane protein
MLRKFPALLRLSVTLLLLAGCTSYAVREQADQIVCDLSAQTLDLEPAPQIEVLPTPKPTEEFTSATSARQKASIQQSGTQEPAVDATPQTAPGTQKNKKEPKYRLQVPPDIPGAKAPPFRYPEKVELTDAVKKETQAKFFPPLPSLGPELQPAPGPNGNPLTLSDLQRLARANNPDIKRAVLHVSAMEGAAIQAGLHPNPNFGYVADEIGVGGTAGFQGLFFEQMIKTAGKLELARQVASVDVANARVALRATENDVATRVRSAYFAVLVARENVRVNRALTLFTEEVYQVGIELLRSGIAVPYEPMQLRAQVFVVRGNLVQARTAYLIAWKQLASALGLPGMPPTQLAGRADSALPVYDFEKVKTQVLTRHTDLLTAQNDIIRARLSLRLGQVNRYPDFDLQLKEQKDYTVAPNLWITSIQATVGVPIWDRNQGNIRQAEAQLVSAEEEPHKVRDDLYSRLADAFGRYEYNRVALEYFSQHILPDQVRAYRMLFDRYHTDTVPALGQPKVGVLSDVPRFQDLVTTEQNLVALIQTYLATLGTTWTAVVDVANLLQTDDLFQVSQRQDVYPIPELPPLPCCHPCSPLGDPSLYGADGQWLPAAPKVTDKPK